MTRPRDIPALLLAAALVASCATAPEPGPEAASAVDAGEARLGMQGSPADARRRLLAVGEHGLQVRHWRITDRPGVVASALVRHDAGPAIAEPARARLEREGLRLVRIDADGVEALLADLGGASRDVDGWHGQAYDWREVAAADVDPAGQAIAVGGHVRRLAGGTMRLVIRGWTVPMEDGPSLHLEMRPEYERARPARLSQILGRPEFRGERFEALTVEIVLETGWAYVLTYEAPGVAWASTGTRAETGVSAAGSSPPVASIGPDAVAPITLGKLLLGGGPTPPSRDVLVFVPRIPAGLTPPDPVAAAGHGDGPGEASW